MAIVCKNATKGRPSSRIKEMAIGEIDVNGHPFEIVKLRWNATRKNAEHSNTKGFEDTIIDLNVSTGTLRISYRRPGSVSWMRPEGFGAFIGELGKTQYNMEKLASMYGDGLWKIMDGTTDAQAKAMYEKRLEDMTDKDREYNKKRIEMMYTTAHGGELLPPAAIAKSRDEQEVNEKMKDIHKKEKELSARAEEIAKKEREILASDVQRIREGVPAVQFEMEAMKQMKMHEIRQAYRTVCKVTCDLSATRDELINDIDLVQRGKKTIGDNKELAPIKESLVD